MNNKVSIGISLKNLNTVQHLLNEVLATANVMYIKLRKFHWNVKGKNFMEYHLLFEEQYNEIEAAIDEVAERITTLGGEAVGTTIEFSKLSAIKESPAKIPSADDMVKELLADHETIIKSLRKDISTADEDCNDAGTADMLTGIMKQHEKMAWKLRQYLL